jgi:hypothetical protein
MVILLDFIVMRIMKMSIFIFPEEMAIQSFGWYRKSGMLIPMVSLSEHKETLKT